MKKRLTEKISFSNKLKLKKLKSGLLGKSDNLPFPTVEKKADALSIIVFNDQLPLFDQDSGSLRLFQILKILAEEFRVVFVPLDLKRGEFYEKCLAEIGVETISAFDYQQYLRQENFDICILSRPVTANLVFKDIRRISPRTKIIFDTVDVHFVRLEREFEITGNADFKKEAEKFKKIETNLAEKSDQVWCVTEEDKNYLQNSVAQKNFKIIPNIHEAASRGKGFSEREGLLFVGSYKHRPNVDAVFYFLQEIFPRLLAQEPHLKFYIVGSDPTPELLAQNSNNVIVKGFVPKIEEIFDNCRVFIAPLRYGAGMKGKIGQALSHGLPIVTTEIGIEGINLEENKHVLLGDNPDEFAKQIMLLYDNNLLWQRLSDSGYEYIEKNFGLNVIKRKIYQAINEIYPEVKKF